MSIQPALEPRCTAGAGAVSLRITPRSRDLGGLTVRRVLPSPDRQMVGPFIFFDEMGPATFAPGSGIQVRPHPHIGIATITYLFDGEIVHRDSLGYTLPIRPGAVNLMTAGRGIVHSERADPARAAERTTLHGIQSWIALPDAHEETDPGFEHIAADALPEVDAGGGAKVRIIIGSAYGASSPVRTYSPVLYLEARMPPGTRLAVPQGVRERAAYVVSGAVSIDGEPFEAGGMAVFAEGRAVEVAAREACRLMIVGGDPVGERTIWWNFVSSSPARIEQAKRDWREGRFGRIEGDDEFIPLPER